MESKHCKPAFERAEPDRRNKVLQTGIDEFSRLGFENANINVIAKKAGISIGLMYKYFETKEDLFILCLEEAISELHAVIEAVLQSDDKILVRAEKGLVIGPVDPRQGAEAPRLDVFIAGVGGVEFHHGVALVMDAKRSGTMPTRSKAFPMRPMPVS